MRDKNWKKEQKRVNKAVRAINLNVFNDDLWLGRFYAHQINSKYFRYEDNSGGCLYVELELVDKKTGKTKNYDIITYGCNDIFLDSHVWEAMNDFIVEVCDVWKENPRPIKGETQDFRKGGLYPSC